MPDVHIRQIKVMISSTRADLVQYREEASKVIKRVATEKEKQVQIVEVSMERETQSGDREFAVAVSKRWIEESDWVVVMVGWNYGTISDEAGADGLSVTEWEFRHASELGKKLFVFITGDPGTTNQYRYTPEENVDLKDWRDEQTEEQKAKLKEFRQQLSGRHAEMFANLQMFRERLEKTLRDAVDDLPPEIQPGTPLAELILEVTPHIRDCIRRVELIANCKQIHDCLHEVLQYVIRPLREQVLSVWEQEEKLSKSRVKVIIGCVNKAAEQRGTIKGVSKSIGAAHWVLRDGVDKVLNEVQNWMNLTKDLDWTGDLTSAPSWPSRGRFAEDVDNLAGLVEFAFSEADQSMMGEESELRDRYSALLKGLKQAREQRNLSPLDHQRLDEELGKVEAIRERLKNKLTTHHSWQEVHNKLQELDSVRENNPLFERQLNLYRNTGLPKLLALADGELGQAYPYRALTAEAEQGGVVPVVQQAPAPLSPGGPDACHAFVDRMRRLKESLEALRQGDGAVTFDEMSGRFDDAFYCVDKRTLGEVNGAETRVVALEEWLDGLATGRRKSG